MNKNYFCVIMAGGVGSRFWPLSRIPRPKQFLDVLGTGRSLLQQTFDRYVAICPPENIFVVTNESYKELVEEQLPLMNRENILLEPMRRNTAPCIAYANFRIKSINPNAMVIVAPADHLILKEAEFHRVIRKALDFTEKNDALLTLGIKPNRPETGYGYIQIQADPTRNIHSITDVVKVKTFTEKPNIEMAKIFLQSGEFYWNSGMFIWSLKSIMASMKTNLPEIIQSFEKGESNFGTPEEKDFIRKTYSECKSISIDYGVMEKADNVYVLGTEIGWSDLGTWGSLYENSEKDKNNNAVIGKNIKVYNTKNCIVNASGKKLVVLEGIEDCIVVETDDVLMICNKQNEQNIRQIVNAVELEMGENYI